MDKKPYNKIDDFFKQAFEQSPQEEHWNAPDEEVWDKLLAASREERKRSPIFLYWRWTAAAAILALVTMVLGIHFVRQARTIDTQAAQIERLEEKIETISKNSKERQATIDFPQQPVPNNSSDISAITTTTANSKAFAPNTPTIPPVESEQQQTFSNTPATNNLVFPSEASTPVEDQPVNLSDATSTVAAESVRTDQISLVPLRSEDHLLPVPARAISNIRITSIRKKRRSKAYLTASATFFESAQKFDQLPKNRRAFEHSVTSEQTLNLGLQAAYPIAKNWLIEGGLRYFRSTAERSYQNDPKFLKSNEQRNSRGELESQYSLSFSSSESVVETDIVLARSSDNTAISDGQRLEIDVLTETTVEQLHIPLLLSFQQAQQRWRWNIKAGFLFNLPLNNNTTIKKVIAGGQVFTVSDVKIVNDKKVRSKNTLESNFYLGTSIAYQIQPNLALQIEPYFTSGLVGRDVLLRPRVQTKVYPKSTGIQVGVNYLF